METPQKMAKTTKFFFVVAPGSNFYLILADTYTGVKVLANIYITSASWRDQKWMRRVGSGARILVFLSDV